MKCLVSALVVSSVTAAMMTTATRARAQEAPPDAPVATDPQPVAPVTPVAPLPTAAPADEPPPTPDAEPTEPLSLPAPAAPTPVPPPAPVDAQLYGGIFVSGVGAALLVVAGVAVSRIDQLQDDPGFIGYRDGFAPDVDVCDSADAGLRVEGAASPQRVTEICDEASRWEITNYVAVPGGIAMLGMGLYLTLTSDTARRDAPVAVLPVFGPDNAGLTITGHF